MFHFCPCLFWCASQHNELWELSCGAFFDQEANSLRSQNAPNGFLGKFFSPQCKRRCTKCPRNLHGIRKWIQSHGCEYDEARFFNTAKKPESKIAKNFRPVHGSFDYISVFPCLIARVVTHLPMVDTDSLASVSMCSDLMRPYQNLNAWWVAKILMSQACVSVQFHIWREVAFETPGWQCLRITCTVFSW